MRIDELFCVQRQKTKNIIQKNTFLRQKREKAMKGM